MSRKGQVIGLAWGVGLVYSNPDWNRTTSVPKSVPRGGFEILEKLVTYIIILFCPYMIACFAQLTVYINSNLISGVT